MEKVRKIISEIVEKQEINTVYFVGCGGSLSGFFPAKYFLSEETKKIKVLAGCLNYFKEYVANQDMLDFSSLLKIKKLGTLT